ncbi:hypothetical protein PGH12_00550 [Chryseobacterium wangxinyae]|uniref:hypothetical protein n=1 Tax=Chryseobacterium sp. CY350 TaxID=2997336 RepID=UPI002271F519|nr:hypothetical protein [Chryseobacterium sp. CY350]MCY0977333.1 hypothetical protein [Chryseobacterium sp. CY350]WBZ95648.1 hypothetical protein PGH12_00550 [Chryseobacterium sp. CY350]
MELDNFKDLWKKENSQNPPEISLERQNEIHSPLQMLKINMQTEFWLMIISTPMIFTGLPSVTDDQNIRIISILVSILTLMIIIYYYSRFRKLYKLLKSENTNTNYDLFNLKTQLLVSKQIYISYYISYIPLAFLLSLIHINFQFDIKYNLAVFISSFVITILVISFILKYWLFYMYGKYIDDVVHIIDELNDREMQPRKPRRKSWFENSQKFLIKKLGIIGNVINTIIWFILGYCFIFLFFLISILLIIFIGVKMNLIDLETLKQTLATFH